MKFQLLIIMLFWCLLSASSHAQQKTLQGADVNDSILRLRREIVAALDVINSMLSEKNWLSPGLQLGFVDNIDDLPKLRMPDGIIHEGKRVSILNISPPDKVQSKHQLVDIRGAFRLPRDWIDSANERGNLLLVNDNPISLGRAFAFAMDKSNESVEKMIPLPKLWVEEFFHANQTVFELKVILRQQSLTKEDVAKLELLHSNSSEPVRCLLFAKLVLANAWKKSEIGKNIFNSKSLYEAAVKTLFCLNRMDDFTFVINDLKEFSRLKSDAILGIAFGCYLNLKKKRLDLLQDLKSYRNLAPFRNPDDKILLASIQEKLLKVPSIKILNHVLRLTSSGDDAEIINALLKASNIPSEINLQSN